MVSSAGPTPVRTVHRTSICTAAVPSLVTPVPLRPADVAVAGAVQPPLAVVAVESQHARQDRYLMPAGVSVPATALARAIGDEDNGLGGVRRFQALAGDTRLRRRRTITRRRRAQ